MPIVNGRYQVPSDNERSLHSPTACAFLGLKALLWNVLAYEYDAEDEQAQVWRQRAAAAATGLRRLYDDDWGVGEAELAIAAAWEDARADFAAGLERERSSLTGKPYRFRKRRGVMPIFF